MSASDVQRAEWLDLEFWNRLDQLEGRHQRAHSEHEAARRTLERMKPCEVEEVRRAWQRYCEVIASLDEATAAFEALRRT
jgi:hypothetical protein